MAARGRSSKGDRLPSPAAGPRRRAPVRPGLIVTVLIAVGLSSCTGIPTRPMFGPAASGPWTRDIKVGTGAGADSGMVATIHYTMQVAGDPTIIDSSYDRGQPFSFRVGTGIVIQGLDLGILGMRVGGLRELVIPPDLAYGAHGIPPLIPPNATLIMRVELVQLSR